MQVADKVLPVIAVALGAITITTDMYDDIEYPCGCCTVPDSAFLPLAQQPEQSTPASHRLALESEQLAAYMAHVQGLKKLGTLTGLSDSLSKRLTFATSWTVSAMAFNVAGLAVWYLVWHREALRERSISLSSPLIG
ncbi:unnamed protein product [Symbiodinium natans]|uniref:Uncharacterized protein n=1 Tax=Symbiodinium natans TaxID=878477 RepID=A0A812LW41_9DINO|nr:unnamed protein product [Symbiodinium natans]